MEIYPERQLAMLLTAWGIGLAFGLLWDLFAASRILFSAYEPPPSFLPLYARPLPRLGRGIPLPRGGGRRVWRLCVIAAQDLVFCLLFCCAILLVLYEFNDGAWRFSVPILALLGLALWRRLPARLLATLTAYLAFGLSALSMYVRAILLWPLRLVRRFLVLAVWPCLCRAALCGQRRLLRARSVALCRTQLAAAAMGFSGQSMPPERKKKGCIRDGTKEKEKKKAIAMGHHGIGGPDLLRGAGHHRGTADGMESAPTGKGSAGAGKGRS